MRFFDEGVIGQDEVCILILMSMDLNGANDIVIGHSFRLSFDEGL